ncbi:unnamed protein product [Toxocara canis]|uniref:Uncharacterized protein n=1 Tax=Toxocara canis TaxID=6265 RepID=A0A183V436_TOXCA|nr:unnamed protein product [Toxocara canis]
MIVENDCLLKEKQRCCEELNDVIIYLKHTIEEQDYEIARLEDIRKEQTFEHEKRIRMDREVAELEMSQLKNDIEKCRAENLLMSKSIGRFVALPYRSGSLFKFKFSFFYFQ